jgi:transketolase
MLHLSGYNVSLSDLQQFRQLGSITPGHPENFVTPGVEVSTGPLGQGICNAVGMAMAEAHLRATYAKDGFSPIDHFTYVICGDGCLQEGVSGEASSLAGHLGLGRLIVLYDDNHVTIDGDTALSFTEDVNKRYEAYGWHVQTVNDVNNLNALRDAIVAARAEVNRPSIIKVRTIIGQGSAKQGTGHVHGAPLGASDLSNVKKHFGFDPSQSFVIPDEVREVYSARGLLHGAEAERLWNEHMATYTAAHPQLAGELHRRFSNELPMQQLIDAMPKYSAQV